MNNAERDAFLMTLKTEIKAELQAHSTMMDKVVIPQIAAIEKHLEKINGSVGDNKMDIATIKTNCAIIQKNKEVNLKNSHNRVVRTVMVLGVVITLIVSIVTISGVKIGKKTMTDFNYSERINLNGWLYELQNQSIGMQNYMFGNRDSAEYWKQKVLDNRKYWKAMQVTRGSVKNSKK